MQYFLFFFILRGTSSRYSKKEFSSNAASNDFGLVRYGSHYAANNRPLNELQAPVNQDDV